MRDAKRDETYALQDWAHCEAPSSVLGRAEEKSSMAPPAGAVGGYNHHCIREEVKWRSWLLYANPLGHRSPANGICETTASSKHANIRHF